jgi:hypothetical protein
MHAAVMKQLRTFEDVVDALGGSGDVGAMVDGWPSSVWNWQKKRGRFPAKFYKGMTEALAARGYSAPAELWGQVELIEPPSLRRAA